MHARAHTHTHTTHALHAELHWLLKEMHYTSVNCKYSETQKNGHINYGDIRMPFTEDEYGFHVFIYQALQF